MERKEKIREGENLKGLSKGGVLSVYEGEVEELKGFDALILTVTEGLELETKSVKEEDIKGYKDLKLRREKGELEELEEADVIVLKAEGSLKEGGYKNVICIVTPRWENGIGFEKKVEKISEGMRKAMDMTLYHNLEGVVISAGVYKEYPEMLIGDLLSHYGEGYRKYNKVEICVAGKEERRLLGVLQRSQDKGIKDVYKREGEELIGGILRQLEGLEYTEK